MALATPLKSSFSTVHNKHRFIVSNFINPPSPSFLSNNPSNSMLKTLLCSSFLLQNTYLYSLPRKFPYSFKPFRSPFSFVYPRPIHNCKVLAMAAPTTTSTSDSHKHSNRLATEHSPYLLQHAHNPVNWYPWDEEAFAEARKRDVPIFLSTNFDYLDLFEVGYSTCHWCHVMEVESFENEEVAKLLNDWFVSVKVDREERPDIDKVYMTYVQALYGGGGWPLSVFLSPDLKPLMGGTYFPPEDKYGRPGFKTILK
ncbi:hypothetical protein Pint_01038 [Pistacia integerrima]|uniref:Uncharacterized protein n=1 Tax=Pistacia integerrima TaxID=434235 RepID=A0ACC0ZJY0_9ROSI|nr:hypothetical protein Pint_01038 [Pistacia integerrima]